MLKTMRDNMPLVMWTLVFAFLATIVFSWGMGGFETGGQLDGVVGRIGSQEILYDNYNRLVQDRLASMRSDNPELEITEDVVTQARSAVWNDMVRSRLMMEYQKKLGIVTSDEEIAFAVQNNPPSYIRDNENFQTNGQFDPAIYDQFLRDPSSSDILIAIENEYRTSMGNQKVIDRVISPVVVSPPEVWDEYVARSRKFKSVVVSFPLRNFPVDSAVATDEAVRTYYEENKDRKYRTGEKRKLAYITVPVEMTPEDTQRVISTAEDIMRLALDGDDFGELAREYSDDAGSAAKDGSLGWFRHGRMVAEFDSAAFAASPGDIVGPIATRFGAHVIKVEDKSGAGEEDSVQARHILFNWEVGPDTDARAAQKARDFADAAKAEGFAETVAKFELEINRTAEFEYSESGQITGLGRLLPVMEFAFKSKVGAVSYVYRTSIRGKEGYSVFDLEEVIPAGHTPLVDLENTIKSDLYNRSREDAALRGAETFRSRITTGEELMTQALAESLKVDTSGSHARRDFLRPFGQDENIARQMLDLNVGQLSPALVNSRGAYVAELIEKIEPDSAAFVQQQAQLAENILRTKQNRVYSDWLEIAKAEIGVDDLRYLYYTEF